MVYRPEFRGTYPGRYFRERERGIKKGMRFSERQMERGEAVHWFYDFKRVAGIIAFLILSLVFLWILLNFI